MRICVCVCVCVRIRDKHGQDRKQQALVTQALYKAQTSADSYFEWHFSVVLSGQGSVSVQPVFYPTQTM